MATVPLLNGRVAVIDDEFEEIVRRRPRSGNSWYLDVRSSGVEYAFTYDDVGRKLYLHQLIIGETGARVDHKNQNGLDNRRENLRFATHSENMRNRAVRSDSRSEWKGVSIKYRKRGLRYEAYIYGSGRRIGLGTYGDVMSAVLARDFAARRLEGEFAFLQFPRWTAPPTVRANVHQRLAKLGY